MLSFKTLKIKWAQKLLRAKYFVVMTDTESVIALDGADPHNFSDVLALTAQTAEVTEFHEATGKLVKDHKAAVAKLLGDHSEKTTATKRKATPAKTKRTGK